MSYFCASIGLLFASMYSVVTCLDMVAVFREPIAILGRVVDVEHLDDERLIQAGQNLLRLVGQRELAAGRQIPALVLAVGDPVDADQDAEHDHDARRAIEPYFTFRPWNERAMSRHWLSA